MQIQNQFVVTGVVKSCNPLTNDLMVCLENGETAVVTYQEITRQNNLSPIYATHLVGRSMYMLPVSDAPGFYSIRAYEDACYQQIVDDFRSHTRNVYRARFKLIAPDGKLAFFQLAQGVNGAVHVKEFSCGRIDSFNNVILPREMPVVIRELDSMGRLVLSTRPTFGNFMENAEYMHLTEGQTLKGIVCHQFLQSVGVMISPNVMTLADSLQNFSAGDCVNVEILRIDVQTHKIRSRLIGRCEPFAFDYPEWLIGKLGDYCEPDAFQDAVTVRKSPPTVIPPLEKTVEPPSFELEADRSPFSSFPDERIEFDPVDPAALQNLYRQMRAGRLDQRYMCIAQAVECLRFATAWQLQRYLYLTGGPLVDRTKLNVQLERLVSLGVLGVLRFACGDVRSKFKTYHAGPNYHCFCEHNPRNLRMQDLEKLTAGTVKARLASNQLLLGMLNSLGEGVSFPDTHPYLFNREQNLRVRPKHQFVYNDQTCFLDAFRVDDLQDCVEKLTRYELFFQLEQTQSPALYLVVEDGDLERYRDCVQSAALSFPVYLTTDLKCLPEPVFETIAPAAASAGPLSLIKRLMDRLHRD